MPTETHVKAETTPGQVSRRDFLARTASGLTLAFFLPELSRLGDVEALGAGGQVNSWLHIGADDRVTLTIGASEMGQGSFSGLAQILAEDLMVDYARIETRQGRPTATGVVPVGASINTVGSGVTRGNFWKMRDAGAGARELLVAAAMNAAGDTDRSHYTVHDGVITHAPSGSTFTYGQVASAAALLTPPVNPPLVPDSQFALIGKTVPRLDIPSKVDGSAKYGLDVRLENMVYAVVKHCPSFGGTLTSLPVTPAGMIAVVPLKVAAGTGRGAEVTDNVNAVAVVGRNTWDAWQAAKRLSVRWTLPANVAALNSAKFLSDAQALAVSATPYVAGGVNPPGTVYTVEGDAAVTSSALSSAIKVVDATYTLPYAAHACMEVLNCTVDYVPGVKCDVRTDAIGQGRAEPRGHAHPATRWSDQRPHHVSRRGTRPQVRGGLRESGGAGGHGHQAPGHADVAA